MELTGSSVHCDLSKLYKDLILNAYRGGKLVYEADADKSLINLLTKRYNWLGQV